MNSFECPSYLKWYGNEIPPLCLSLHRHIFQFLCRNHYCFSVFQLFGSTSFFPVTGIFQSKQRGFKVTFLEHLYHELQHTLHGSLYKESPSGTGHACVGCYCSLTSTVFKHRESRTQPSTNTSQNRRKRRRVWQGRGGERTKRKFNRNLKILTPEYNLCQPYKSSYSRSSLTNL